MCCFQGQEFADQYMLDYQREDDGEWIRFRSRKEQEVGNVEVLYRSEKQKSSICLLYK